MMYVLFAVRYSTAFDLPYDPWTRKSPMPAARVDELSH